VLKDICETLGLDNVGEVARRIDDELTSVKLMSGGQLREMYIVNEPGLYNVIRIRSDKPEAKAFKRWITHNVDSYTNRTIKLCRTLL
jgi:prophage antirepressor-like protein